MKKCVFPNCLVSASWMSGGAVLYMVLHQKAAGCHGCSLFAWKMLICLQPEGIYLLSSWRW